ncbi:MAG: response regulator [Streptosporangiales bacterium]|nr:response regulator [Streptosporangiales bacterium]
MRLLVVEDEEDLVEAVRLHLIKAGYATDVAYDIAGAEERLQVHPYDLLLLDLTLPDGDGFGLCHALRHDRLDGPNGPELRILMLTARAGVEDRVRGLDEGADDYLVKPFALAEMLARVRALLRRDAGPTSAVLRLDELTLDAARHEAHRGERRLELTRKEFGALEYLMTRPGHVISAEELLDHVWDENADPFTNTVRVTVGTLRRKLSRDGEPPLIETVVGRGYRLREET